jgi:cytochrome c biogenesis protein CcmG/thiol:disulfide interchange protein DsbE
LLAQEVAAKYPGQVTFVSENLGASKLADRFGVKGYPAVFLDDVLVASPREFGYFGEVEGAGRYAPWRSADSQARFKADLTRMVDLILAGKKDVVRRERAGEAAPSAAIAALPAFSQTDLSGRPLAAADLAGRVVLVEFWATWCPPCRSTLDWLGGLKRAYGDRIAIVALAVESPEAEVRSTAASLDPGLLAGIADPATVRAFGDITAVPALFLFDGEGRAADVSYGAPADLHERIEKRVGALLKGEPGRRTSTDPAASSRTSE